MSKDETALRKRQQIANANRTMFIWVAATSALLGIAVVISIFLFQKAVFNEKVLGEKSKTASTLIANNKAVDELKNQVRVLNTNEDLKKNLAAGEDKPVQVILDALPSHANSSAFGASMQKKLLDLDNLKIAGLTVNPVAGVEDQGTNADTSGSNTVGGNQIEFQFDAEASITNGDTLKKLQQNLERSIRPIDITGLTIETQSSILSLKVSGHTYYQPAKTITLKDKVVKP
jgi:hypothetical protein